MSRGSVKYTAGSVPSDRLRTVPPDQNKGKGKGKAQEPAKSKAVRKLESLLDGVRNSSGREKDPKGGCFCQAREHDLSPYNSICRTCGLILCSINLPYYACPHCSALLLSEIMRSSLSSRLNEELSKQISKEKEERDRIIQEAREAEGAFPVLSGPVSSPAPLIHTRKVLSVHQKKKTLTVSSYTNTTAPSRPASRAETEDEVCRVAAPPPEVDYVKGAPDHDNPWNNMRMKDLRYIWPT